MENRNPTTLTTVATVAKLPDRRNKRRVKLAQPLRVRPSEPHGTQFDEVLVTINICRNGLYFATLEKTYSPGQRLFITFPYSGEPGAVNLEYIGRVVRVDKLPRGQSGIAVQLVMTVNLQSETKDYRYLPSLT